MHVWLIGALTGFLLAGAPPAGQAKAKAEEKAAEKNPEYKVTGPYTHKNLSVFLIHGDDEIDGKILTLEEAIKAKKVVVHETGTVSELAIENVSNDQVFVQAGDIVRGGRQDRVLTVEAIVPPKSGKLPVASFCVEQGRWSQRGGEDAAAFNASTNAVSSKEMKVAFRKGGQHDVWKAVEQEQKKLEKATGKKVKGKSESSYELTLESKAVKEATEEYIAALEKAPKGKSDVIGYAFAVNGKVNSADVYGNKDLFTKLWPKLLRASVVEAVGGYDKDKKFDAAKPAAIEELMLDDSYVAGETKNVNDWADMEAAESDDGEKFETKNKKGKRIRINILAK